MKSSIDADMLIFRVSIVTVIEPHSGRVYASICGSYSIALVTII
nr:MAG TPA: hypothetical protein [Caudoviricetes sp.]